MRRQEQSGGDDSVNVQAGQNATVHIGVTASEVRDIALDVFRANFLELRGVAEEVARERAEHITRQFIDELQKRNPDGLSSIQDPDMQLSLFSAQKGYATSGDEDLEAALVDLLVDRAGQKDRDLKTLLLNQAIECLPKLTAEQRKALAVVFLVQHTGHQTPLFLPAFYQIIAATIAPFADIAAIRLIDLQYLQAAGAGSVMQFERKVEQAFWRAYCGCLFKGFTADRAKEQLGTHGVDEDRISSLIDNRSIFIPCIRNESLLQFNAVSLDDVMRLQAANGLSGKPGTAGPFETLCLYGQMSDLEIKDDIVSHVPAMSQLFENWDRSGLKGFQLTALGIAIGHSYWRHITHAGAPLDIWL